MKELKDAVKELNESGLIETKIKTVAVKAEDLEDNFIKAVKSIPEEKEDDIPQTVVDVFNKIVKARKEAAKKEGKKEPEKKAPAKKEPEKKATGKKKEEPAKTEKKAAPTARKGPSAMSCIRDYVTAHPKATIEQIRAALEKAGLACKDVSLKMEWKKTLTKIGA
jgi:hypothetical protein